MRSIKKSIRLRNVNYEIRGNTIKNVRILEENGISREKTYFICTGFWF